MTATKAYCDLGLVVLGVLLRNLGWNTVRILPEMSIWLVIDCEESTWGSCRLRIRIPSEALRPHAA